MVKLDCTWVIEADFVKAAVNAMACHNACCGFNSLHFPCQAYLVAVAADAACTVSAHFAHASVGVVESHFVVRLFGRFYKHHAVSTDGHMSFAEKSGNFAVLFCRDFFFYVVDYDEVVSGSVHLPEFQS